MKRLGKITALLAGTFLSSQVLAQTISINRMDVHDLKSRYFEISEDQKVEVEYIAPKSYRNMQEKDHDFVWMIDLDSREMVWRSRYAESIDGARNSKLAVFADNVNLDAGRYGLFYSTHNFRMESISGVDVFLYGLSSLLTDKNRITEDDMDDFYVDLRGIDMTEIDGKVTMQPFGEKKHLVKLNKVRKNRFKQYGIDVDKATTLSIYAVGEILRKDEADVAWLKDSKTGEMIWKMSRDSTKHAGGSRKNRLYKDTISVEKGSYVLSYSSDGSHHYNDWNAQPPYDPQAWGVNVFTPKNAKVTTFDPQQRMDDTRLVSITKLGDNDFQSQHIRLTEDTNIRVIAMGERASRSSMVDHGWILDSTTRKPVWKMKARKTSHAGGAAKNRIIDELINLPAGDYTVQYVTDDSHSYDDGWNASRPHDEKQWGISLYAADKDFDRDNFKIVDAPKSNAITQIIGVRDNARRSKTFELTQDQAIRVYAIGEGDSDEMYDYGYIKNVATGKRVWNMYADETEHAGGAGKNRQVNDVIDLKAGKYKVYYRTDGSHSFGDWNAKPPIDQNNYGITIYDASKG